MSTAVVIDASAAMVSKCTILNKSVPDLHYTNEHKPDVNLGIAIVLRMATTWLIHPYNYPHLAVSLGALDGLGAYGAYQWLVAR